MSDKDPFQIMADEITLIRGEVERLQRTSLDKDEAKALHEVVAAGVADMRKISPELQQILDARLREALADVKNKTRYAAHEAAESAVVDSHAASVKAAQRLLDDAATARRQAWRTFGNFGAWIAVTAAVCLLCGSLATMALQGRADAREFGRVADIYCGFANGKKFTANDGIEYCAVPLD